MYKDMMFLDSSENLINSSEIQSKVNVSENISISDIELNNKEAKKIGKSKGKYITITFNKNKLSSELECLIDTICSSIKSILDLHVISLVIVLLKRLVLVIRVSKYIKMF